MITLKPRNQTIFNHLLPCCLIVKLMHIVYKNISYDNLVFTEQLLEVVGESFCYKLSKTEIVAEQAFGSETMGESNFRTPYIDERFYYKQPAIHLTSLLPKLY